jgi:hypothetical protein
MITSTVLWHIATPILEARYKEKAARAKQQNGPLDPISIVLTPTCGRELLTSGFLFLSIKKKLEICGDAWRQW